MERLFVEAAVEGGFYGGAVDVAAYEHEFDHAVAVHGVPVAGQAGLGFHEPAQLVGGSGGVPLACVADFLLYARLLEEVAGVRLGCEIEYAFGADYAFGPLRCHEVVETVDVDGLAAEIHERAYAVFLHLAFAVVVIVVVMMVLMAMFMLVFMFMLMFKFMVVIIIVIVVVDAFELADPGGGCGHVLEIEGAGAEYAREVEIGIVALYDGSFGLDCANDGAYACGLFGGDFRYFVEYYYVAELNLLYDEALDVLFADVGALQGVAAGKFAAQAQGVDHRGHAVEAWKHGAGCGRQKLRDGTDGLGYGRGFADAAGFDDYVVEVARGGQFGELLSEVHLEGAADASVLKRHEVGGIFGCAHDAAFADERCVDVDLAYVVDDDGKADAAFVGEYTVEECCLAAA